MSAKLLTADHLRSVLHYCPETGAFTWIGKAAFRVKIGSQAGATNRSGYVQIHLLGSSWLAHRLAWLYMTGAESARNIRHLDGDRSNNRWANLTNESSSQRGKEVSHAELLEALDYSPDTGAFVWKKRPNSRCRVGQVAGSIKGRRYLYISINKKNYAAHRLAWFYMYGKWPDLCVDHINGVKTDNRISNLRDVTAETNSQNQRVPMPTNRTSGLLGVHWSKSCNKWRAQISIKGKPKFVGLFDDKHEAHAAYLEAKRKYHAGCTI